MLLEEYSWFHVDAAAGHRESPAAPGRSPLEEEAVKEVRFVAYGVVAPIIVSVGILGNLSVIVLLRLPQFKGVVFSFFTVLAVADLFSLTLCISPLHHILAGATVHHSTAVWYSYFELLLVGVAMSTSVLIVVSITIYRFFSVCRPTEFQRLNTHRFVRLSMAAAFVTAAIAWLPISFLREPRVASKCEDPPFTPPDNQTWWVACLIHDTSEKGYLVAYVWVRQTLVTFLPIVAVVTLNLFTLRGFMRHRRMRSRLLNQGTSEMPAAVSKSNEEKHLMGLLVAVMSCFVITIVPSGIANAVNSSTKTSELEFVIFSAVANNLEILNHTLNFYLYVLCSKPVRDTLKKYYKKHSTNVTGMLDRTSLSREHRSERSAGDEEGKKRNSKSPLATLKMNRHTQHISIISLPSESPALGEGRHKAALQPDNATHTLPSCHVNPNFKFTS